MSRNNRKSTNLSLSLESLERRDVPAVFLPHGGLNASIVAIERIDERVLLFQRIEARDPTFQDRLLARFESTPHAAANPRFLPVERFLSSVFPSFPTPTNPTGVYLGSFNPTSTVPSISYGAKLSTVTTSPNPFTPHPTPTNPTGVYLGSFNPTSTVPSISYVMKTTSTNALPINFNPFTPHPTPTNPTGVYLGSFNPSSTVPSISYAMLPPARK